MKPSEVMPANSGGGGTVFDRLPKKKRTSLDEDDAEAEGDQQLVLVRAVVEMADDQPLHQHADDHHEQRAGDHRDDERAGVACRRRSRHSRRA